MTPLLKKRLKTLLKILITSLGLYLSYRQVDWEIFSTDISNYNWWILLICIILNTLSVFIISYRLFLVVNRKSPWADIVRSNFIAVFLNLFLPSTIGGDIAKISQLHQSSKSFGKSTVSVIIDRFYGIISLVILSIFFSLYIKFFDSSSFPQYINVFVIIFSLSVIIIWVIIMNINLRPFTNRVFKINIFKLKKSFTFEKPIEAIYELRSTSKKDRIMMIILSILYHSISSYIAYLGLIFLGVEIPITYVIIFRTISTLLLMLPISIGGLGVRDIVFKELYGQVTSSPKVLLLAPFTFVILLATGLIGGMMLIFDRKQSKN